MKCILYDHRKFEGDSVPLSFSVTVESKTGLIKKILQDLCAAKLVNKFVWP